MLRPQTWQELKTNGQIITCSSCGRILFYDPAHEPPAPEPPKKKRSRATAEADADSEVAQEITPTP
jgi:hypothetical protein